MIHAVKPRPQPPPPKLAMEPMLQAGNMVQAVAQTVTRDMETQPEATMEANMQVLPTREATTQAAGIIVTHSGYEVNQNIKPPPPNGQAFIPAHRISQEGPKAQMPALAVAWTKAP